ncbi:Tfp pilus assembly protein FimT/FimU [Acinetobacter sp. CS-2]|uniref:pilus assembly FimT family protein n=1 Tax=Acinetobacter sp. CS-2 TaxID=2798861 RepID=UPI0019090313|nr:prepilin-type N-terminal cleavage/methylation domain-containing protein [Acinetobacter sp. CS-2]QQN38281.1 prepilin-type N-terminal cleavage/methylation domain-containing protein [Acinetobacter sp. CS-2]
MVRAYKGVTLIELVIVIAILGISAASLIPLGASWVAKTQVEKTQKLLVEAYNKATTEAIKNPNGKLQTDTNPMVAKLTVTNGSSGAEGVINVKASDDSTVLWSTKYPAAVSMLGKVTVLFQVMVVILIQQRIFLIKLVLQYRLTSQQLF